MKTIQEEADNIVALGAHIAELENELALRNKTNLRLIQEATASNARIKELEDDLGQVNVRYAEQGKRIAQLDSMFKDKLEAGLWAEQTICQQRGRMNALADLLDMVPSLEHDEFNRLWAQLKLNP